MKHEVPVPEYAFTIATTPPDTLGATWAVLLFFATSNKHDTQALMEGLKKHPVLTHLCRMGTVISRETHNKTLRLIADVTDELFPDNYLAGDVGLGFAEDEHGFVRFLDFKEEFYRCTLPNKTLGTCRECFGLETNYNCLPKQVDWRHAPILSRYMDADTDYTDPQFLLTQLRLNPAPVGPYEYISPAYTRKSVQAEMLRPPEEHKFSKIGIWRSGRVEASVERRRMNKFRKSACAICAMRKPCEIREDKWDIKRCLGPLEVKGGRALERQILDQSRSDYSPRELARLLMKFTGPLPFKIKRRDYSLTCKIQPMNDLQFGLVRVAHHPSRRGNFTPLTKPEITKLCKQICGARGWGGMPKLSTSLNPSARATLFELASLTKSPTSYGIWHKTPYEPLYISYEPATSHPTEPERFFLHFRYNSNRWIKEDGMCRGWITPFRFEARNLEDIFEYYGDLESLSKTVSEHRHEYAWR